MNTLLPDSKGGRNRDSLSGERVVRHSHHYDAALHRALTETGAPSGRQVLEHAAASAAYRALAGAVEGPADATIRGLFAETGLGEVESCEVGPTGGSVTVAPSGYVQARVEMFGSAPAPACDAVRGVLAGALGAVYGSAFEVVEEECAANGGGVCRFVAKTVKAEAGPLSIPELVWPELGGAEEEWDHELAVAALEMVDAEERLGEAGYGRLWAELYAQAAHEFERGIPAAMGPKFGNLASVVLTEAAHLGTFYSIGRLIRSAGWRERVASITDSREEWARILVGLANRFGWGTWRIDSLVPGQRLTIRLFDGYEANAQLSRGDEPGEAPRCYFARGFVAALMNVVFAGDIQSPAKLNQTVYNSLFRSPSSYRAMETRCAAHGDPFCEFVATPLSPGILRF